MKYFLFVFLVLIAIAVYPPRSRACFCLLPELADSFKEARSVFVGETLEITEPKRPDADAPLIDHAHTIKFKVVRSWKGVPFTASEYSVLWLTNCYECLPLPRTNETYLVFATPLPENKTSSLVTMCNRTVGVQSDSNLKNPSIDPERDMKQLDVISNIKLRRQPHD